MTQQSALRYLLLPKKSIDESLTLLKAKKVRVKHPVIEETPINIEESSDDDKEDEPPKDDASNTKRKRAPRRTKKQLKEPEPVKKTRKPRAKKE